MIVSCEVTFAKLLAVIIYNVLTSWPKELIQQIVRADVVHTLSDCYKCEFEFHVVTGTSMDRWLSHVV